MGHGKVYFREKNVRRKIFGDRKSTFSRWLKTRKCAFVYNFSLKLMCGCVDVRVERPARAMNVFVKVVVIDVNLNIILSPRRLVGNYLI